jgi:hypothetical protein
MFSLFVIAALFYKARSDIEQGKMVWVAPGKVDSSLVRRKVVSMVSVGTGH